MANQSRGEGMELEDLEELEAREMSDCSSQQRANVVVGSELSSEEVCYPNNNWKLGKTRGLALIVSMEKGRPRGAVDRWRLEALSLACGFSRVVVLVDGKASDLCTIISEVVNDDVLEEDECFLCFINGHGGTQDGNPYILDENKSKIMVNLDIVKPFRQTGHLRGKPKIFVINVCREHTLDLCDNSDSVRGHSDIQQVTGPLLPLVTELSDCLLVFSTSEGSHSWRDSMAGSVFVNQLMETVMENINTTDVLSMMTMVIERVYEVESLMKDPDMKTTTIVGQCCEIKSTLRKKLYWKTDVHEALAVEREEGMELDDLEELAKKRLKLSEEEEGETIPKTAAAGSQNSCLMRHDIRDMGFHDFDQEFDSDRILVLFKSDDTCTLDDDDEPDEPQVHITFFHVEAMCYVLGIGVPHSSVVLKGDTIQVIGAAKEEGWRDLWTDPAYQQMYSPRILEVSFPKVGSLPIQRSLQYSTEESVQMFGLGVAGSDLVISGQRTALGEGNADRGREMGRQAGEGKSTASREGEGEGTPDKKPVRDQTSGSRSSSGAAGPTTKADQPTAAVTESHTLTIEVILSPDDNDIEPCEPLSMWSLAEDRIALKQFIMDTALTVTFYQDQDFSSPSKEMDIKVRSRYGLQTFDESTSAPRNTEFESFGWYHNGLRTSFQALDSAASFLQETTHHTTPGSSGPTCTTGGEVGRGGQLGVRAGGGSLPVSLSGQLTSSSTTSRQVSVPSTFQATNVGDRTKLAWRTELQPGIKPAELMDDDIERERATSAGLLNTVTTEFKGHWYILKDETEPPHYSYDLVVSRRFYMVRRKKSTWSNKLRTRVITENVFEQKLTKRFLINHSFSHMLDATRKFRWTLRVSV